MVTSGERPAHWIWVSAPATAGEAVFLDVPPVVQDVGCRFDEGRVLRDVVCPVVFELGRRAPGALTDNLLLAGATGLVFSGRLRAFLERTGVDSIQYLDCRIVFEDDEAIGDYRIANIVGRVSGVDLERSILDTDPGTPGKPAFIETLVLDDRRVAGYDIFRLAEATDVVVVSDRLRMACERERITGVTFCAPSAFCA